MSERGRKVPEAAPQSPLVINPLAGEATPEGYWVARTHDRNSGDYTEGFLGAVGCDASLHAWRLPRATVYALVHAPTLHPEQLSLRLQQSRRLQAVLDGREIVVSQEPYRMVIEVAGELLPVGVGVFILKFRKHLNPHSFVLALRQYDRDWRPEVRQDGTVAIRARADPLRIREAAGVIATKQLPRPSIIHYAAVGAVAGQPVRVGRYDVVLTDGRFIIYQLFPPGSLAWERLGELQRLLGGSGWLDEAFTTLTPNVLTICVQPGRRLLVSADWLVRDWLGRLGWWPGSG